MRHTHHLTWYTIPAPNSGLDEGMRSCAIDNNGTVFLPAEVFYSSDSGVIMDSIYDGIDSIDDSLGNVYLPAQWLAKKCPESTGEILEIQIVVQAMARNEFDLWRSKRKALMSGKPREALHIDR